MDITRQEIEKTREDIRDKARLLCNIQKKVIIRTIPSTRFPKGAKYEGFIFDVKETFIVFNDTYKNETMPERIMIYVSEISSPADIWEIENGS